MSLFLVLLAACVVGSFLVTSLIWVIFWVVGVFEVPQAVKNLLAIRPSMRRPQNANESRALPAVCEADSSNAFSNFRPLGLTAATVVLLSAMSTSQLVSRDFLGGEMTPNQMALPNAIGS